MTLPKIGDGQQMGDGNANETLNVGAAGATVQVAGTGGKIGMYGVTPAAQRASSVQATSALATSSAFGATQLAFLQEVGATLQAIGAWKGSA